MYRYLIEFTGSRVDETRLRDVLERELGVKGLTITRERVSRSQSGAPKGVAVDILSLLADNKPWKTAHIVERLSATYSHSAIAGALHRLEARGSLEKVRHGIYVLPGAPHPNPSELLALLLEGSSATQQQAWDSLARPQTALELREATGVTRQRVEQILSKWTDQGLVVRHLVAGERAQHVYVRADCEDREEILRRPPLLTASRARLLSALPPEARAAETHHRATVVKPSRAQVAIIQALQAFGPLRTTEIPERMLVKFKNPRSIHLALRTLQKRGIVSSRAVEKGRKQLVWSLVTETA